MVTVTVAAASASTVAPAYEAARGLAQDKVGAAAQQAVAVALVAAATAPALATEAVAIVPGIANGIVFPVAMGAVFGTLKLKTWTSKPMYKLIF